MKNIDSNERSFKGELGKVARTKEEIALSAKKLSDAPRGDCCVQLDKHFTLFVTNLADNFYKSIKADARHKAASGDFRKKRDGKLLSGIVVRELTSECIAAILRDTKAGGLIPTDVTDSECRECCHKVKDQLHRFVYDGIEFEHIEIENSGNKYLEILNLHAGERGFFKKVYTGKYAVVFAEKLYELTREDEFEIRITFGYKTDYSDNRKSVVCVNYSIVF